MSKHVNFQDYLKETDEKWTSKYLKKGKIPLVLALEDAKKKGVSHEIIDRAEEQGMLDGSLGMTYEGAQRIYDRIRNIVGANVNGNGEYLKILDSLDPITHHDIIATTYFCLDPNVRDAVQDKLENLYRVV